MKWLSLVSVMLFSFYVKGETFNITAEYKPESYDVSGGRFINTTKCSSNPYVPYCDNSKPFESSTVVKIPVSVTRTPKYTNGKTGYFVYFRNLGPKSVTLTNKINTFQLTLIPTHIGAMVSHMNVPISEGDFWPFDKVEGDCHYAFKSWAWFTGNKINGGMFMHEIDSAAQKRSSECYVHLPASDGLKYNYDWINYGFKLNMPNPLEMPNGVYTGSLKVMIGRNQDIDLGDATYSGGTEHEFKFTLTVRHQLKVDFPEGGNNQVNLLPLGGWSSLNYGKNISPRRLQRDLNFRIWFSAKFYMILRCQYLWADSGECALKDSQGRTVPLNTYYVDSDNKMSLLFYHRYQPISPKQQGTPEINAARAIRFQVVGDTVTEMMKYPGSSFKGDVTLIFDAAID